MIEQLLQRDFVLRHLDDVSALLDREIELLQSANPEALKRAQKTGVTVDDLRRAKSAVAEAQVDPKAREIREGQQVFLPPDATVSSLQTALQRQIIESDATPVAAPLALVPGKAPITDVRMESDSETENVFEQFGPVGLGWLSVGFASLVKLFRNARPFTPNPAPPCRVANTVRLVLLSDWGTGLPRARKVGLAARTCLEEAAAKGIETHAIHLGDVYYSGWAAEYDAHFLPFWPVLPEEASRHGSWCLNGNHDMYSGGHGYFDHLLKDPRFARQAQSSYFSLENDFWQILALDTAHEDFDLAGNQADWVLQSRNASPSKGGVLLSHHQPFSGYEDEPGKIRKRLRRVLERDLVFAWFWGHEHKCAWYAPRDGVRHGRCIGHGGVPVLAPKDLAPATVTYEFGDWVVGTEPRLARFGFAVVDCVDERMHVKYVNEDGTPHNFEDLVLPK